MAARLSPSEGNGLLALGLKRDGRQGDGLLLAGGQ